MDRRSTQESGHRYEVFGLRIDSELPLPELRETCDEADTSIRFGRVDGERMAEVTDQEWSKVRGPEVDLGWPGVGRFRVRNGTEITVDPAPEVIPERLRLFLLGPVAGVLLHQRGLLVLHASAVSIRGRAVAFLGGKRWGKSTIAGILHSRGHTLITDDLLAVDGTREPRIQPGLPQLKLWPDSLRMMGENPANAPRLHPDFEKREYRVEADFPDRQLPLRAVYVLDRADRPGIDVLGGHEAMPALIAHWYCGRFGYRTLEGLGLASHFLRSVKLVHTVPIYRLSRSDTLRSLQQAALMVERSLERGDTGRTGDSGATDV